MAVHILDALTRRRRKPPHRRSHPRAWVNLPVRKLGAVRTVFLTRRYVFKLPGRWAFVHWRWWWDSFLRGLLSNMQERRFAAEGGFLIVMPRARAITPAEWEAFDYRAFVTRGDGYAAENFDSHAGNWRQGGLGQPLYALTIGNAEPCVGLVPAEYKPDSFGVLSGRVVAIDYG